MRSWFVNIIFWVATGTGCASLFTALYSESTVEHPSGGAGLYAALIGMCVTAIFLTESIDKSKNPEESKFRLFKSVFSGALGLVAAHLWVASEAEMHPTDLSLPASLAAVFGLVSFMVFFLAIVFYFMSKSSTPPPPPPNKQADEDEPEDKDPNP